MYTLAVKREFIARHFLIGGDWGEENRLHSHHYVLEVRLEGRELDRHGYLVDIVDVEKALEGLVAYFKDRTLNELPEFAGLNPSVEHFTRICCRRLLEQIDVAGLEALTVKIWENEIAWAAYRERIKEKGY